MSEWKWQEGRKAGGQSLITREGREGERKTVDGSWTQEPKAGTDSRGMLHEGHCRCISHSCLMACVLLDARYDLVASPTKVQMKSYLEDVPQKTYRVQRGGRRIRNLAAPLK